MRRTRIASRPFGEALYALDRATPAAAKRPPPRQPPTDNRGHTLKYRQNRTCRPNGDDQGEGHPPRGRGRREDVPHPALRPGPVLGQLPRDGRHESNEEGDRGRPRGTPGADDHDDLGHPRPEGVRGRPGERGQGRPGGPPRLRRDAGRDVEVPRGVLDPDRVAAHRQGAARVRGEQGRPREGPRLHRGRARLPGAEVRRRGLPVEREDRGERGADVCRPRRRRDADAGRARRAARAADAPPPRHRPVPPSGGPNHDGLLRGLRRPGDGDERRPEEVRGGGRGRPRPDEGRPAEGRRPPLGRREERQEPGGRGGEPPPADLVGSGASVAARRARAWRLTRRTALIIIPTTSPTTRPPGTPVATRIPFVLSYGVRSWVKPSTATGRTPRATMRSANPVGPIRSAHRWTLGGNAFTIPRPTNADAGVIIAQKRPKAPNRKRLVSRASTGIWFPFTHRERYHSWWHSASPSV